MAVTHNYNSGGDAGLELERRIMKRVFWPALAIMLGVALVNSMTLLTDAQRSGVPVDSTTPWVLEFTSVLALLPLVPLMVRFVRAAPLPARNWALAVPIYVAMSAVFSGLHVLGMVVLRKLAFWALWGQTYTFFDAPLTDLIYEYRKDLMPFAILVVVCHTVRRLEENRQNVMSARAETLSSGRLTLKSGSRTIWLDAASFDWASAAGNYVEVSADGTMHLIRMPLSALGNMLTEAGIPAIRVHRSRLVNRTRVRELLPTRDGDFIVRLVDGTEVRGSRRYRDVMAGA